MQPICCDTSFLFSLYLADANTAKAVAYARRLRQPLTLSHFNAYEFEHALQYALWRQKLSAAQVAHVQASYQSDIQSEQLIFEASNLASVLREARRISALYTAKQGYRSFDILHVAAAIHLKAAEFISFNINQRKLAKAEGIKLNL